MARIQLQAASRSELGANINEGPRIHNEADGWKLDSQRGDNTRNRTTKRMEKRGKQGLRIEERGAKRMEDPENVMSAGDLWLVVLAGNGRTGIKSKTCFFRGYQSPS